MAEAKGLKIQGSQLPNRVCGRLHVLREEAAREHEAPELELHGIAHQQHAAIGKVQRDASGRVPGSMDNAHAPEGGEFVPIVELHIHPGGAGVLPQQVGLANPGEQGVGERVGQRPVAFDVRRFNKMHAGLTGNVVLDLGQSANMVDVVVGDDDVLDIFGRAADFLERLEDADARTGVTRVNQRYVIFNNEVGAGAARADLEQAREHLSREAKGRGLMFIPAVLPVGGPVG